MCLDLQSQISIIHLLVGATKCGDLTRHSKREENHLVRQWDRFMKWTKMNLPLSASIAISSLISVIPSIQSKDGGWYLYRPKFKMVHTKPRIILIMAIVIHKQHDRFHERGKVKPLPFELNTFSNRYCPRFLRLEIFSMRAKGKPNTKLP